MLRQAKSNDTPFGGVRLFLFGDFLQLPSVRSSQHTTVSKVPPLFQSTLWRALDLDVVHLTTPRRTADLNSVCFSGRHNIPPPHTHDATFTLAHMTPSTDARTFAPSRASTQTHTLAHTITLYYQPGVHTTTDTLPHNLPRPIFSMHALILTRSTCHYTPPAPCSGKYSSNFVFTTQRPRR